jgi:flagellar biogenesis protein FliO
MTRIGRLIKMGQKEAKIQMETPGLKEQSAPNSYSAISSMLLLILLISTILMLMVTKLGLTRMEIVK